MEPGPNLTTIIVTFLGFLTTLVTTLGWIRHRRIKREKESNPPPDDLDTTENDLPSSRPPPRYSHKRDRKSRPNGKQ